MLGFDEDKAEKTTEKARDVTKDAVDRTAGAAKDVTDKAADKAENFTDKVSATLKSGSNKVEEAANQVQQQSTEIYDTAVGLVKKHPVTFMMLAILAGTVIGAAIKS